MRPILRINYHPAGTPTHTDIHLGPIHMHPCAQNYSNEFTLIPLIPIQRPGSLQAYFPRLSALGSTRRNVDPVTCSTYFHNYSTAPLTVLSSAWKVPEQPHWTPRLSGTGRHPSGTDVPVQPTSCSGSHGARGPGRDLTFFPVAPSVSKRGALRSQDVLERCDSFSL